MLKPSTAHAAAAHARMTAPAARFGAGRTT
jgi:hypothetical protein